MHWWEKLADEVKSATESVASAVVSAAQIQSWISDLISALIAGDEVRASELYNFLSPLYSNTELAKLILREAARRRDATALASAVAFVTRRQLLTNSGILGTLWDAVEDDPLRKIILETLANRVWNLDNLLRAIADTAKIDAIVRLLADIAYDSGRDLLWRQMLKYSSRNGLEALFESVVRAIHGLTGGREEILIWQALQIESAYRRRTLDRLLPFLVAASWFDLQAVIRYVFEQRESLLKVLLAALLETGVLAWGQTATLLDAGTAIYANDRDAMSRLLTSIVGALAALAESAQKLSTFASVVANWLHKTTTGTLTQYVGEDGLLGRARDLGVANIPLPAWLVGQAFGMMAGSAAALPGTSSQFARALCAALQQMGSAGEAILALIMRIPAAFLVFLPFLVQAAASIPMNFLNWFGQDVLNLQQPDRKLLIKELPAPGPAKYMILSDIHRDAKGDVVDPVLYDCGNFSKNQEIYLRMLKYCLAEGYTVIENGDCEEMWFRPHLIDDPQVRSSNILGYHQDIYMTLKSLYDLGRYYRTRGNHDNWWVLQPGRLLDLQQIFGTEFVIYDALVIPGVLTMETDYLQMLDSLGNAADDEARLQILIENIPLGLSPDRYTEKLPLFVFHGHQVDFWNCDEHQLLGFVITNSIGVPADGVDALPYYLKGVDLEGNPAFKFTDMLVDHAPWGNWPPEDVARRQARHIEFMAETDRKLIDDYMFSETLAASLSLVLSYGPAGPFGVCGSPKPKVQILAGHTHTPQSRPYLNFAQWLPGDLPPIAKQVASLMKAPYYNSGNCGWWEGILWGIEITSIGQPRLAYWDRQCYKEPHLMSWELHDDKQVVAPSDIAHLLAQIRSLLPAGAGAPPPELMATLAALTPFIAPVMAGVRTAAFGALSIARQYAVVASALVQVVLAAICGSRMPQCDLTLEIDLQKLPRLEPKNSELAAPAQPPSSSMRVFFARWLDFHQLFQHSGLATSPPADLKTLAGLCFHAALLYRSGLLNSLGHLLNICVARELAVDIEFNRDRGTITMRLHHGSL